MNGTDSDGLKRRPVYLVIALIAMWLVGMEVLAEGFQAVMIVQDPLATNPSSIGDGSLQHARDAAVADAVASHASVALPLGLGRIFLVGLLVLVAAKALFLRRASTSFALQVIVANVALMIAGYVIELPLRAKVVDALTPAAIQELAPKVPGKQLDGLVRVQLWWQFRVFLGIEVGALVLAGIALTRRTAREELAAATPEPEER